MKTRIDYSMRTLNHPSLVPDVDVDESYSSWSNAAVCHVCPVCPVCLHDYYTQIDLIAFSPTPPKSS